MKKLLKMLIVSILCLAFIIPGAACVGSKGSDDPQTLDIYLLYKGYQDEWLKSAMAKFQQEPWVKEKYPELKINYEFNQEDGFAGSKLPAGKSVNSFDLMFGVNLGGYSGTNVVADLTDIVYNAEIPGENGATVKSKIPDSIMSMAEYEKDNQIRYYTMCYVQGFWSMLYNHGLLQKIMGTENYVPVTTQEFLDTCQYIKDTGYDFSSPDGGATQRVNTPIMLAHNGYWDSSFPAWWLQYEGLDGYHSYYQGVVDGIRSRDVMRQKGRLRSLEVIEDVFTSGYGYEYASSLNYIQAQTNFLAGNGVFHFNGDYFVTEMSSSIEGLKQKGIEEDIRYMRMPVISAIVEKLTFYNESSDVDYDDLSAAKKKAYDEKLANIVRDIDNNLLYKDRSAVNQDVSSYDWDIVAEARQLGYYSAAGTQTVVIPGYSPAKNLAADFLIFMYSDKMIKDFVVSSNGNILPSKYDWASNEEVFNQIHPINKTKFQVMVGTSNYPSLSNYPGTSFALGRAGLGHRKGFTGRLEIQFMLPESERVHTAKSIYQADIDIWTEAAWSQLVAGAGY